MGLRQRGIDGGGGMPQREQGRCWERHRRGSVRGDSQGCEVNDSKWRAEAGAVVQPVRGDGNLSADCEGPGSAGTASEKERGWWRDWGLMRWNDERSFSWTGLDSLRTRRTEDRTFSCPALMYPSLLELIVAADREPESLRV